ncbi:uncharacterized protein L201_004306 [Kwoniella dendrophila CBS 6074]|uniref:Vacuolar protein-sorting-associated protein 36 n=1 Tax=Kwoniella dendrophila CBS 6074 TaxID=1295534 RepID=A0AAX4JXX4_9TREE
MNQRASSSRLPEGISADYWSTWTPIRQGASVPESLDKDLGEEWIGGWDSVGLYEGNNKVPSYQTLNVHLTNQRLILIPESSSNSSTSTPPCLQVQLRYARQTEFYAGFMRSSAKITLTLGLQQTSQAQQDISTSNDTPSNPSMSKSYDSSSSSNVGHSSNWTCNICGYVNPINHHSSDTYKPLPGSKCTLCGIPYSTSQLSVSASSTPSRSATPIPVKPLPSSKNVVDHVMTQPTPGITNEDGLISCPACTFLNSPLLPNCEICSTTLPKISNQISASTTKEGTTSTEQKGSTKTNLVRLSFRKGGEKEAYNRLKAVLSDKAWERGLVGSSSTIRKSITGDIDGGIDGLPNRSGGVGIDGILQKMDLNIKEQSNDISEAFKDLEILMLRAGEMVKLANSINSKLLSSSNNDTSEEETTMIKSTLVQLGLNQPAITKEMIKDEKKFHISLAKELGQLLTGKINDESNKQEGLMIGKNGKGVIALDEVWGLWMRARGVSLLPPSTLIAILPILPEYTSPSIQSLILPSSLNVLFTPNYSINSILLRTLNRLLPDFSTSKYENVEKSFTILEFSDYENLPIGLSKEFVEMLENYQSTHHQNQNQTLSNNNAHKSELSINNAFENNEVMGIVRDDQSNLSQGGVRWYRDIISTWPIGYI